MSDRVTTRSVLRRAPEVVEARAEGELVLWWAGSLHRLDHLSALVWAAFDGRDPVALVAADVATAFAAPLDRVTSDVLGLAQKLLTLGLLVDGADALPRAEQPPVQAEPATGPGDRPDPSRLRTEPSWAYTSRRFKALSFDFGIRSTDHDIGAYLDQVLGSLTADGSPRHLYSVVEHDGRYELFLDDVGIVVAETADRAVRMLLWHVNSEAVRLGRDHLIIHAAAAVSDAGALVLPGQMNAGKTTLVAGLVRSGYRFLTDELVALNLRSRLIDPYPRPLNLEGGSRALLPELRPAGWEPGHPLAPRQWHVDIGSVWPEALAASAVPRWLIAPRYDPDAVAELETVEKGEMLELLHGQAMNLDRHGSAGFSALVGLVTSCHCARLVVGSLPAAVARIRDVVEKHHFP